MLFLPASGSGTGRAASRARVSNIAFDSTLAFRAEAGRNEIAWLDSDRILPFFLAKAGANFVLRARSRTRTVESWPESKSVLSSCISGSSCAKTALEGLERSEVMVLGGLLKCRS